MNLKFILPLWLLIALFSLNSQANPESLINDTLSALSKQLSSNSEKQSLDHIKKVIKNRKLFLNNDSAKKVVYLAIMQASKKWTMPIRNWKPALNRFIIEFEARIADYI